MNEETRKCLTDALADAESPEAIDRLDACIRAAHKIGDSSSVAILARNAGLLASNRGQLERAEKFFKKALAAQPRDGYLYLALVETYVQTGDRELAKASLATCLELAKTQEDDELERIAIRTQRSLSLGPPPR